MKIVIALALMISTAAVAQAQSLSPADVVSQIENMGAKQFVQAATAGPGAYWANILRHIESGRSDWLGVVKDLQPGVDAGTSEDLTDALAYALIQNPSGVLAIAGPSEPLSQVCAVPLIEPTDAEVTRWKTKALRALSTVVSPELKTAAVSCATLLKAD